MTFNLFSVIQLLDKDLQTATADQSIFMTFNNKEIVAIAKRKGNLYKMIFRQEKSASCMLTVSVKTWHERLAHQNVKYVRDFLKKNSIKYVDDWDNYVCEGCIYGKHYRISHSTNNKIASKPLDLIHVHLCEMNTKSLREAKYFLLFKDDFSHIRIVYFLKTKDETTDKLNAFMRMIENQFERKIKCL